MDSHKIYNLENQKLWTTWYWLWPCLSSFTFIYTFYPWIKVKDKISHDREKFHPWNIWKIKKCYLKIKNSYPWIRLFYLWIRFFYHSKIPWMKFFSVMWNLILHFYPWIKSIDKSEGWQTWPEPWSKHTTLALKYKTDAISNGQYKMELTNLKSSTFNRIDQWSVNQFLSYTFCSFKNFQSFLSLTTNPWFFTLKFKKFT